MEDVYKPTKSVLCVRDIPHYWLFPRMSAVVHHGGAGTTAAGLLSGVPSILAPRTIDQHSWAHLVYELGAGPAPVPFKKLTAESLAASINEAITNEAMRKRAAEIGQTLAKEDGLQKTVDMFTEYINKMQ